MRSMLTSPWLRAFSKLIVLATVVLIFLGGQVKSHDAGLAVPDWPTTYGENMFLFHPSKWVGNIYHEHLHRIVASGVGFLSIILAVWLGLREQRRWLRWTAYGALAAVIAQGILGGLTVRYFLPAPISVSHAVLAQTFLIITVIIAYGLSRERARRADARSSMARESIAWNSSTAPALYLVAFVFVQLILGAILRHTESGLAIPDFPSMGGQYLPVFTPDTLERINDTRYELGLVNGQPLEPATLGQVWIHFIHRLGAVLVTLAAMVCTVIAYRDRRERPMLFRSVALIDALIAVQISLGIATVLTVKTPLITSLHVAVGAVLLGMCSLFALRAHPLHLRASRGAQTASMNLLSAK